MAIYFQHSVVALELCYVTSILKEPLTCSKTTATMVIFKGIQKSQNDSF